jgi:hypothetical protein
MHVITSMGPAAVELERNFQLRLRQLRSRAATALVFQIASVPLQTL